MSGTRRGRVEGRLGSTAGVRGRVMHTECTCLSDGRGMTTRCSEVSQVSIQGQARDGGVVLMDGGSRGRPTQQHDQDFCLSHTRQPSAIPKRAAHLSSRLARVTDGLVGASGRKGTGRAGGGLQAYSQPYSNAYARPAVSPSLPATSTTHVAHTLSLSLAQ